MKLRNPLATPPKHVLRGGFYIDPAKVNMGKELSRYHFIHDPQKVKKTVPTEVNTIGGKKKTKMVEQTEVWDHWIVYRCGRLIGIYGDGFTGGRGYENLGKVVKAAFKQYQKRISRVEELQAV